jgi:MFS family permease
VASDPIFVINDRVQSRIRPRWLSAAAYAGMFGFGIVMALLGALLPVLARRLQFDLSHAGDLFLIMNAAMLVTTLALGPLVDRFGHKAPLVIAPLFVAVALGLMSRVDHIRRFGDGAHLSWHRRRCIESSY